MNAKIARKVQDRKVMFSKSDTRYWLQDGKLRKDRRSPYFTVQICFKGNRHSYPTGTNNKQTAARKAAEIYRHLVEHGTEATIAKFRSQKVSSGTATIGEWISAAKEVARVSPTTFTQYCRALRKIAADLLKIQSDDRKFSKKGSKVYRDKIDTMSLDIFTSKAVNKWILDFVKSYANNPKRASRAKNTCNSTLRQAKSLFSQRILKNVQHLKLPDPLPFAEAEPHKPQDTRYRSKIDLLDLMQAADSELREKHPDVFVAFLIECCTGLRRGEIDTLHWEQVDLDNNTIWVELTEDSKPKTDDSRASVPIDETASSYLKEFKRKAEGRKFVIEPDTPEAKKTSWGAVYRAKKTWSHLVSWLRTKGVDAQKPIHELRKEFGSLYATHHGIYVASTLLRHAKVSTTEAFYADLKDKPVLPIGKMLQGIALKKGEAGKG
jgi:integrase